MCNRTDFLCGFPGSTTHQRGRLGAYLAQRMVTLSTMDFMLQNRNELLDTQMEVYRRGVTGADRPACCPAPYDVNNNWMREYNTAYVIPMGAGQRSGAEANRLVEWLFFNGIEVHELRADYSFGGQTFQKGSYVVWLNQALRGLADSALNIGDDISACHPALRSSGRLEPRIPLGRRHRRHPGRSGLLAADDRDQQDEDIRDRSRAQDGQRPTRSSSTRPRRCGRSTRSRGSGVIGKLALEPFPAQTGGMLPAGTILFATDHATKVKLATAGRDNGLLLRRIVSSAIPDDTDPIDGTPRIAVLTAAVNQDIWSLRDLGFTADPVSTATINSSPTDPLVNYDVVWNTGNWPATTQPTARARLTAFFAAGGGYVGTGANGGANFLNASGQVTGFTTGTSGNDFGESGIIRWNNTGGVASPIVGPYPAQDTAIVDPPTWFTAVPATMSVDARFPLTNFFAAGLWPLNASSASAPGSALIAHGMNIAGTARLTSFSMNPLYRADPEREWPMVGSAVYWAAQ